METWKCYYKNSLFLEVPSYVINILCSILLSFSQYNIIKNTIQWKKVRWKKIKRKWVNKEQIIKDQLDLPQQYYTNKELLLKCLLYMNYHFSKSSFTTEDIAFILHWKLCSKKMFAFSKSQELLIIETWVYVIKFPHHSWQLHVYCNFRKKLAKHMVIKCHIGSCE